MVGEAITHHLIIRRTKMINGKTVSLCMVVYNRADLLKRAVESVSSIIDELIIVDQGSTEKLISDELLKESKIPIVYHRTTCKGNADYDRMFCYSLASKEFLLAMDADEVVPPETIVEIQKLFKYEFDVMWFLFDNSVFYNDKKINISDMLGEDPHPRLWRKTIVVNNQPQTPIIWGFEAHQMPKIVSDRIVFSDSKFIHNRSLVDVIKTHLKRGKNINPQAQQEEKRFVKGLLDKFGDEAKQQMIALYPELKTYLKG
jgi:glycosyltransferase involved in cell wall biosynthesis